MALKAAGSILEISWSSSGTSKPRAEVKSSSLPIMTSTYRASSRLTSTARSLPAARLPQRGPVVEVVGDDGAGGLGRPHGLEGDLGGGSESAAKMPPVCIQRTPSSLEDPLPVDVAGLELRDGGVGAVGGAQRRTDTEALLDEVEADPRLAPDAVVRHPLHVAQVDAAGQHAGPRRGGRSRCRRAR